MKRRVCCAVISLTFIISIMGCTVSIQDKPLPMSQDNIQKYSEELGNALKKVTVSPSQDRIELLVDTYKMVMEKKMGFSFDKTLRNVMLFYPGETLWHLMNPIISFVDSNPKNALEKGFISQRTFDIIDTGKKARATFTKDTEDFIGFVVECQSQNQGVCNSKALLSILNANSATTENITHFENKYDIFHMGIYGWITKPDGTPLNTNGLLEEWFKEEFIVNKNQIAIAKKYTEMIAEEKIALSK